MTPPIALPMQLLTGLVVLGAAVSVVHSLRQRRPSSARIAGTVGLGWLIAHILAVLVVSLTSTERVLERGESKRFCGFYLDCHAMMTVRNVQVADTLGVGQARATATGTFYVITIEQSSDAEYVPIGVTRPESVVIDAQGRRYRRSIEGENALRALGQELPPLGKAVRSDGTYETKLVFDLPADITRPMLLVTEAHWWARLSELLLVGDEDSLLHAPTVFSLNPLASSPASRES